MGCDCGGAPTIIEPNIIAEEKISIHEGNILNIEMVPYFESLYKVTISHNLEHNDIEGSIIQFPDFSSHITSFNNKELTFFTKKHFIN